MRSLNLVLTLLLHSLRALGRSRSDLILENLALRQQVAVFTRTKPRAQLEPEDRILWSKRISRTDRPQRHLPGSSRGTTNTQPVANSVASPGCPSPIPVVPEIIGVSSAEVQAPRRFPSLR